MYFVEKTKGINFWRQFDYAIFITVLLLSGIGLLVVSSATKVMPNGADGSKMLVTQVVGLCLGIIVALIISAMDYNDLKTLGVIYYLFCVGLLILVLFIGSGDTLGSRSWIKIPGIGLTLQPSELAKTAFIIVASIFLERIKEGNSDSKNIMKLMIYSAIPVALVLVQKDFGTTVVYLFVMFILLFVAGISYKYIIGLLTTFLISLPVVWFFFLNENRKERIRVFLDPERDRLGAGLNVYRSKLAIGSGQVYGKGLYSGLQTQTAGVPVKESDFIFSVIGEELGFIGCAVVIILLFFLLIRAIYIARNARDHYGTFLVVGIVGMFGFHVIENIGMTIGLMPVTGIPLPFISHGATFLIANYLAIGIILSVSMRRKKTIFNSSE